MLEEADDCAMVAGLLYASDFGVGTMLKDPEDELLDNISVIWRLQEWCGS